MEEVWSLFVLRMFLFEMLSFGAALFLWLFFVYMYSCYQAEVGVFLYEVCNSWPGLFGKGSNRKLAWSIMVCVEEVRDCLWTHMDS